MRSLYTPLKYASFDKCPDKGKHTKSPGGYLAWHEWAAKKARTHVQERCPACGFWAIWKPKSVLVQRMKYSTIVADPPWRVHRPPARLPGSGKGAGTNPPMPYPMLSVAEISALPVGALATDVAHLYLWTINRYVEQAYSVVRAWGFTPSTLLVWAKTPRGLGAGGHFALTTEYVLFARRGVEGANPAVRVESSWWNWTRPEIGTGPMHSRKPEAFLDLVESVSPGPYLEMFSRRNRLGWDTHGNESLGDIQIGEPAA